MRLSDYLKKLLGLAETLHRWSTALATLDRARRKRIAIFAEKIAGTLARASDALLRLQVDPADGAAMRQAIREFGRIAGYVETIVHVLEHHLDGRKLTGVKRRLEQLVSAGIDGREAVARVSLRIDRLNAAEGYFRALADALRT